MTILVVDDEKELRNTLKNALESEGYDVITAENGLSGILMAQEKKPDLILLDISMPVMDGFTALFKLKQNPATKDIPVIILTGQYVDEENLERGFNLGAVEYLYKPIKFTELISRVRSVLRLRSLEIETKKIELMTEKFFIGEIKKIFTSVKDVMEFLIGDERIGDEIKVLLLENYKKIKNVFELADYFLKLSDISAGVEQLKIENFDFNLLVKDVVEGIKKKFDAIDFELIFARDSLVKGDQEWLRTGFSVLFEAMAEAMNYKGKINISEVVRAGSDGKYLFVTVRDEAKKLPSEVAKFLFNPYLISGYEFKPDYNLMAMKIFQKVIELNGGSIVVEPSEQETGNKFIIRLHAV